MSDDVREFTVRGSLKPRGFFGTKLAESVGNTTKPRWLELTLYREWEVARGADGLPAVPVVPVRPRGYVLHVVGRSLVYHQHESDCGTGVETPAGLLQADAEPCPECKPPPLVSLPADGVVDMEENRPMVHVCAGAEQVIEQLQDPRAPAYPAAMVERLSAPAQRLLSRAAAKDKGIAELTETVSWL